jgi:hypothetical protein
MGKDSVMKVGGWFGFRQGQERATLEPVIFQFPAGVGAIV